MKTIVKNLVKNFRIPGLVGILVLDFFVFYGNSFSFEDPKLATNSNRSQPDTIVVPFSKIIDDDITPQYNFRLTTNHPGKPMHPYFRDSYRIIRDMRRLVLMFNYRAVTGYESVGDLIEICQKLPEPKQAELISTVFVGAAANFFSVETNKQLKKKKINFVEWRADKVIFRNRFRYFNLHVFQGWNNSGVGLYVPAIRTQFYQHANALEKANGFLVFLSPRLIVDFNRYNGSTLVNPFYVSKIGTFSIAYNWDHGYVRSRFDLIKSSSIIIRIVHVNYLKRVHPDQLLSEVILSW